MRILFFVETFNHSPFVLNQINDIAKSNTVMVVTCNDRVKSGQYNCLEIPFERGFTRTIMEWLEIHDFVYSFSNASFRREFQSAVAKFKPDIIHIQFAYDALKVFDNCKSTNQRFLIHFRGYDASAKFKSYRYKNKISKILANPNVNSVFVSQHLMDNLTRNHIYPTNKPYLLYSNTDTSFFNRTHEPDQEVFTFIQISSFREKKGHFITIRAFKKLIHAYPRDKIKLKFTGYDDQNSHCLEVKKLIEKLELNDHVDLLPYTNRESTRDLLQSSHVAVLHSITAKDGDQEGIPNFLMEAMAMEMPVISTIHSGIPELVSQENGILVEEYNVDSSADAMKKLFSNYHLIPKNREKILKKFDRDLHTYNLQRIYQELSNGAI